MVTLLEPQALYYLLFLIPLVLTVKRRHSKIKKRLLQMYSSTYIDRTRIAFLVYIKIISLSLVLASIVFSYAKPVITTMQEQQDTNEQILTVIAIDVSRSMYVKEGNTTRIEKIIRYITELITSNSRAEYMVYVFTDTVAQIVPRTNDIAYIQNVLLQVQETSMLQGSTDFTTVVETLTQRYFSTNSIADSYAVQFILASDGEVHSSTPEDILLDIATQNIEIVVLFAGSSKGGFVNSTQGRMVDKNGIQVISYANPQFMQALATTSNATFIDANNATVMPIASTTKKEVHKDISWIGWLGASLSLYMYIISILL